MELDLATQAKQIKTYYTTGDNMWERVSLVQSSEYFIPQWQALQMFKKW